MVRRNRLQFGPLALALAIASPAAAQAQAAAPGAAAATVDPAAVQALQNMGAYLKTLTNFELRSNAKLVGGAGDTDLKVTLGLQNTYRVERPNRLFIEIRSDKRYRQYFYDGKTFAVNVPAKGAYAKVPAASTIAQLVKDIDTQYDLQLPLSELFKWAIEGAPVEGLRSAHRVGHASIGGVETDGFAFRDDLLDFQLWIATGAKPLPMKIVVTANDNTSHVSYTSELTWDTNPKFAPSTFVFKPEAKASEVPLAQLASMDD